MYCVTSLNDFQGYIIRITVIDFFCDLELLEVRRLHNDVIMLYKILHSHVSINMNTCIPLSQTNLTRVNK